MESVSFQDRQLRALFELSNIATIEEWYFGNAKDGSDKRGVQVVIRIDQSDYGCYLANEDKLFIQLKSLERVNAWAKCNEIKVHIVDVP